MNAIQRSLIILCIFLTACMSVNTKNIMENKSLADTKKHSTTGQAYEQVPTSIKFAQFNVSFAHDGDPSEHFEQWIEFMQLTPSEQQSLITKWQSDDTDENTHKLAERVIQIRNIAAIIQAVRPDVLLLNEFNNDGEGKNYAALEGFQNNYLAHAQSLNSVDGGELQQAIDYPFVQNYATNTGLSSGIDLNNNGFSKNDPNDAYGFGFYHGHYAFALMSKYEIDTKNTRTFQTFKRKDLPEAVLPTINVCNGERALPKGMECGDNWFNETQWQNLRLSSKNHVDAPIIIPTASGNKFIHALLSHPTPPAFDSFADNNKYRNSEENAFWLYYINGANPDFDTTFIYDDNGKTGGLMDQSFVIMGDLNADAQFRTGLDPRFNGIKRLMENDLVNQSVAQATGTFAPTSSGGEAAPIRRPHPVPATRTSTFGARADYSVPSADLQVIDSGVYWRAENEAGHLLFTDKRVGERGTDKEISSDHRLVWVSIDLQ